MSLKKHSTELKPAIVPVPGRLLARELQARGWTQRQLAEVLGRPYQTIHDIIKGKQVITPETSAEISAAFGMPSDFWHRLQMHYDAWRADRPEAKRRTRQISIRAAKLQPARRPLQPAADGR